jgi:hypothetical protein
MTLGRTFLHFYGIGNTIYTDANLVLLVERPVLIRIMLHESILQPHDGVLEQTNNLSRISP